MGVPSRVEAYLSALAKTEGRTFDPDGRPVLTDEERALVKRAEHQDFVEAFQRAIGVKVAMKRLEMIFSAPRPAPASRTSRAS